MTYIPQNPKTYIGSQLILNSDRLIFNAKTDSILLYSDKAIGFSTNGSFHFDTSSDTESHFIVNSPNIYLGLDFDNTLPKEPAVLGNELVESLEEVLDLIQKVYSDIAFQVSHMSPGVGPTSVNPKNITLLNKRTREIENIKEELQSIKSETIKLV